ncbi:hypothetical protein LAZ67_23000527, partial [Cordylochernes scorpioides]
MIRLPPGINKTTKHGVEKPEENAPKMAKVTISAEKVMAIVFWDCKGVLLVDYLPPNTTVNAARYCEALTKLRAAIKRKRPGLLSRKVLPSMTMLAHAQLERPKRCWKTSNGKISHIHLILWILPQTTTLLHLGGKDFANDDEVQAEANHWLRKQDTAWYNSGIKKLLQRYQKCLDRNSEYVEKSDEEVIDAVTSFFESLETSFFLEGIKALEHRWK